MTDNEITNRAIALARMWALSPTAGRRERGDAQLVRLLERPGELGATLALARGLAHTSSEQARAKALEQAQMGVDPGLGPVTRSSLAVGRTFGSYAPAAVAALAGWRLRSSIGGLIVGSDGADLARHITSTSAGGRRINLRMLSEKPIGEAQARRHTKEIAEILQREDVDYLSLDPTHLVAQVTHWDVPGEAERVAERLRPLLRTAMETRPHKFINLDVEEYADIALTTHVYEKVLSEEEFMHLSAGLTLQAYLPDSNEALERLIDFATRRVDAGGAPLKVRLVKGGNLDGEQQVADHHGRPSPTYPTKPDTDANHLRLVEMVLRPEVAYALRVGVATHNLFHIAHAHLLAEQRGVGAALDVETYHRAGPLNLPAIQEDLVNPIIGYTPVLPEAGWYGSTSLVARRLADMARAGSFLKDLAKGRLQDQEDAFLAARQHAPTDRPRHTYSTSLPAAGFRTTATSDPALATAREELIAAVGAAAPGTSHTDEDDNDQGLANCATGAQVDAVVSGALEVQTTWAATDADVRTGVLRAIAEQIGARRAEFVGVLCAETGKTISEADAEVSEAIDYALHHAREGAVMADRARSEGLRFVPDRLVLAVTPRTSPLAAGIAGVAAALAVGAAVIVRPSCHTPRSASLTMQTVRAGLAAQGAPAGVAAFVRTDEARAGQHLIAHPEVDSVILTGGHATAALFTSWRVGRERGPRVFAAAPGNNSAIVMPSADTALAARAILDSAFINAGQSCLRVATVLLVGDWDDTGALRTALVDGARSATVDRPTNPATRIGPLAAPAGQAQREALESLSNGEEWLLAPQQLDDDGRLWRPGIKLGTGLPDATATDVPVLTLLHARTLAEALEWQNKDTHGLLGVIHSRAAEDINEWLATVEVGSAYVNTGVTGPTVGRAPVGGWKTSVTGPGAKPGGPNFLGQLGEWQDAQDLRADGEIGPRVADFLTVVGPWLEAQDLAWLELAARSDAAAREELRRPVDRAGLETMINVLRYRPGPRVTLRAGGDAELVEVLRVHAAALATGVDVGVSIAPQVFGQLPEAVQEQWRAAQTPPPAQTPPRAAPDGVPTGTDITGTPLGRVAGWRVETLAEFDTRASTWTRPGRIRCVGVEEIAAISEAVSTSIALIGGPVVRSGHRELLTFLHEQSVVVGNLDHVDEGKLDFIR